MKTRSLRIVWVIGVLLPGGLTAQDNRVLPNGSRLRVVLADSQGAAFVDGTPAPQLQDPISKPRTWLIGDLEAMGAESLILLVDSERAEIPYNGVSRIEALTVVGTSWKDGVRLGTAFGLIAAVALPYAACGKDCDSNSDFTAGQVMLVTVPVGVALGAGIGALIGSLVSRHEWREIFPPK